jgi:hypothetical protein
MTCSDKRCLTLSATLLIVCKFWHGVEGLTGHSAFFQVFEKLFTSELQPSQHPTITVQSHADRNLLVELLRFCYTHIIPEALSTDKKQLLRFLLAADKHGVIQGVKDSAKALRIEATFEDACAIFELPESVQEQKDVQELIVSSQKVIQSELKDLNELYRSGRFKQLKEATLAAALENEDAHVHCENTVFVMVWEWLLLREAKDRGARLTRLSRHIGFRDMTTSFLVALLSLLDTIDPRPKEVAQAIHFALLVKGSEPGLIDQSTIQVQRAPSKPPTREFDSLDLHRYFRWDSEIELSVTLAWEVDETIIRSLVETQAPLQVALGYRSGYTFSCTLARRGDCLVLKSFCRLFCSDVLSEPLRLIIETEGKIGNVARFCAGRFGDSKRYALFLEAKVDTQIHEYEMDCWGYNRERPDEMGTFVDGKLHGSINFVLS